MDTKGEEFQKHLEEKNKNQGFSPIRSFRKAILAVIAMNRIQRLVKAEEGFGKYNYEDIDNLEILGGQEINEEIYIDPPYQNPYAENEVGKSFKLKNDSIDSSLKITPIKDEENYSVCRNLKSSYQNTALMSGSKKSNSSAQIYNSSIKYKRKNQNNDFFPYINLNVSKKYGVDEKDQNSKSYERSKNFLF